MTSLLPSLYSGFEHVLTPAVLLTMLIGSIAGIIVGALPGIGPAVAISVMLPATFGMPPIIGLTVLLAIYCGSWYGGAVPAILINTPGTPSAAITTFDGYPMARAGAAQRAICIAFTSSFVGGMLSVVSLVLFAPLLVQLARSFGAPEYLLALLMALALVLFALRDRVVEGALMLALGLAISTVGLDPNTMTERYTFGVTELYNGLPLIPVVVGLFGVAQGFVLLDRHALGVDATRIDPGTVSLAGVVEVFRYWKTLLKSSLIGITVGALPGIGVETSGLFAYAEARRASSDPASFGKGNPEGVVASESANNAVTGAAMVPVLALGIPGDAITALIMGVFIIHNIFPGPQLFAEQPQLVSGIFASMFLMNIMIFLILLFSARYVAKLAEIPPGPLSVGILLLSFIGAYSVANNFANVWIALIAGIFGYVARRLGLPIVGLMLGIILGPLIEERLRQTLSIGQGSIGYIVERPISLAMIAAILMIVALSVVRAIRERRS
ncbi:MAG: tripartite tricarboxylate transporter permease [Hyphomicrobiaceae bacterium]